MKTVGGIGTLLLKTKNLIMRSCKTYPPQCASNYLTKKMALLCGISLQTIAATSCMITQMYTRLNAMMALNRIQHGTPQPCVVVPNKKRKITLPSLLKWPERLHSAPERIADVRGGRDGSFNHDDDKWKV